VGLFLKWDYDLVFKFIVEAKKLRKCFEEIDDKFELLAKEL
ncbi:5363_t:CDS:1, partial [Dentiscutata heterogama]